MSIWGRLLGGAAGFDAAAANGQDGRWHAQRRAEAETSAATARPARSRPAPRAPLPALRAARERAAEIAREERMAKIAYMNEMPEDTPAGTGESLQCFEHNIFNLRQKM